MSSYDQNPYPIATAFNQQTGLHKSTIENAMTFDELDKLRMQNEDRIKSIEEKYFKRKEESRQVRDIF